MKKSQMFEISVSETEQIAGGFLDELFDFTDSIFRAIDLLGR